MRYTARATRWADGWEIHVEDVGVTQTRTLAHAIQQAADLISTYTDTEVAATDVDLVVDLGDLSDEITRARAMVRDAEAAQRLAAAESRRVARNLRSHGLSVTDAAIALGVSKGRVSQLVK